MGKLMLSKKILILIASIVIVDNSYAFIEEPVSVSMRTTEHGQMTNLTTQEVTQIKGETDIDMTLVAPLWITLNGRVPVLAIPVQQGHSTIKVNPPLFKDAVGDMAQVEIGKIVSNLMVSLQEVQGLVRKKELDKAMAKIEEIEKLYPRVTFLEFVKASIYLLKGNKSMARQATERGLEAHPDYREGQDFLKMLDGKKGGKDE